MSESRMTESTGANSASWTPKTDAEREAVREQVGRVLANSLFRNSKRLTSLLGYTVERLLEGKPDGVKERTLGIEVFGREPTYDTTQDPVVRMTAVEIRKRLAQYYSAPEHADQIRIEFPHGAYLPVFHLPDQTHAAPSPAAVPAKSLTIAPRARGWIASGVLACLLLGALAWWRPWARDTALDRFWNPILKSPSAVLVCIGDERTLPESNTSAPPPSENQITNRTTVLDMLRQDSVRFSNALTLTMVVGVLRAREKPYRIRRTRTIALQDLREGSVILIGMADNPWTLRLGSQLRFSMANENGGVFIRDRQNPANRAWGYDGLLSPLANVPEAYGLISRVLDPTTGHFVVTCAGLLWGTRAAGECVSESGCLEEAEKLVRGDWKHKNSQIVVSTKVIGENSGPPKVVAAYLW